MLVEPEPQEDLDMDFVAAGATMEEYFKLINSHMHGLPGGKVESESFTPDF